MKKRLLKKLLLKQNPNSFFVFKKSHFKFLKMKMGVDMAFKLGDSYIGLEYFNKILLEEKKKEENSIYEPQRIYPSLWERLNKDYSEFPNALVKDTILGINPTHIFFDDPIRPQIIS